MAGIVILTRLGRPSGREVLERLLEAEQTITAVIAEPRSALLLRKGLWAFLRDAVQRHGPAWLWEKAWSVVKGRLGRRQGPGARSLTDRAQSAGVPVHVVENHNSRACVELLQQLQPDVVITANTRVLKGEVLHQARLAGINLHKSKLPQYAGLDSIFWAIYHGEREIGVTVHLVAPGIDTGDILCQSTFPVEPGDTLESLDHKANRLGADLMLQAVQMLVTGDPARIPQDAAKRSYFSWPTPAQRRELKRRLPGGRML